MEDNADISSSMLVPYADDEYSHGRQLTNSTRYSPKSRFRLPAGWSVKQVIRADGSQTDKYYIEPCTGVKFRSMKDVERRINGEIDKPRQRRRSFNLDYSMSPGSRKLTVSDRKMIELDDEDQNECQLAIVRSYITTPTDLPDGWVVEEVPRRCGVGSDKYYIEPGTGVKFRSMKDVERRINGEIDKPSQRRRSFNLDYSMSPGSRKMIVSDRKMIKLDDEDQNECQLPIVHSYITTPTDLPDGWVVEEVPRRRGVGSDKYYYEPGTGLKFRSLREVERHLEAKELKLRYHSEYYYEPGTGQKFGSLLAVEKYLSTPKENANAEKPIEEEPSENAILSQIPGSCQKNISTGTDQNSSSNTPPMKINWVLASPGGDMWNPFIGEKLVVESVKKQWGKRFMFMIGNQDLD